MASILKELSSSRQWNAVIYLRICIAVSRSDCESSEKLPCDRPEISVVTLDASLASLALALSTFTFCRFVATWHVSLYGDNDAASVTTSKPRSVINASYHQCSSN